MWAGERAKDKFGAFLIVVAAIITIYGWTRSRGIKAYKKAGKFAEEQRYEEASILLLFAALTQKIRFRKLDYYNALQNYRDCHEKNGNLDEAHDIDQLLARKLQDNPMAQVQHLEGILLESDIINDKTDSDKQLEKIFQIATNAQDPNILIRAHHAQANVHHIRFEIAKALHEFEIIQEIAKDNNNHADQAVSINNRIVSLLPYQDIAQLDKVLAEFEGLPKKHSQKNYQYHLMHSYISLLKGEVKPTIKSARKALRRAKSAGDLISQAEAARLLSQSYLAIGKIRCAKWFMRQSRILLKENRPEIHKIELAILQANLLDHTGHKKQAIELLETALSENQQKLPKHKNYKWLNYQNGLIHKALGKLLSKDQPEQAAGHSKKALDIFQQLGFANLARSVEN